MAWFQFISGAVPIVVSLVGFVVFAIASEYGLVGNGQGLSAGVLFTSLSWFSALRGPLLMVPIMLSFAGQYQIALKRVEAFITSPEREPLPQMPPGAEPAAVPIDIRNSTFQWWEYKEPEAKQGEGQAVPGWKLEDLNLTVKRGELVAVVGSTGAGKTSLLSAITGDMSLMTGTSSVQARIAIVPQQSWIFNATVRENVLFGKPYDEDRYQEALRVSCLIQDVDEWDFGDQRELGAKGVNLSGGQKQRISIARAVYADAELYLLDDCLSALDAHVAKEVFDNCIKGLLHARGKTVIFATNRVEFVAGCNSVLVMNQGRIADQGDVETVRRINPEFKAMIAEVGGLAKQTEEANAPETDASAPKKTTKKKDNKGEGAKLTVVEKRETGGIAWGVVQAYINGIGGNGIAILFTTMLILAQVRV